MQNLFNIKKIIDVYFKRFVKTDERIRNNMRDIRELKFIILYKLLSTLCKLLSKILKILGKFIDTQFLQSIEYIDVFDNLR